MGGTRNGIEIRPNSIRMKFQFEGETVRETFILNGAPLEPTPANVKWANRTADTIRTKIHAGTFEFVDYFPDSPRAQAALPNTFGAMAEMWLKSKGALVDGSRYQYKNAIGLWKRILGKDTPINKLAYQTLATKIGDYPWKSGKSCNNYLIPLRGIFEFEYFGKRAAENPMIGIKNMKVVKKKPDPLTSDERDMILADLAEHYDPRVAAYFAFAFFTGMRPEEIIALRWSDVDFNDRTVRIQRVRTFLGSERDGSKTHSERDVDLVEQALAALKVMAPYTRAKPDADIFERPEFVPSRVVPINGGKQYNQGRASPAGPWHDSRSQSETFWKPTLARLGVRFRTAYNCRHTYATTALRAGVNPSYIASQLGHVNTKMVHEVYSRWIQGADKGAQRAAMEAAMGKEPPKAGSGQSQARAA